MTKSNTCLFATVPCLVPEKCLRAPVKNNGEWTGSWLPVILRTIYEYILQCKTERSYTVKKIRRFYGNIPGIWLPFLLPLFLRAFTSRTFLEIKIW